MLELDGQERRRLREALIAAFPDWAKMEIMVSEQLDVALPTISSIANPLDKVAFDLVVWARSRGQLGQLIVNARRANPDNVELFVVAQRHGLTATAAKRSMLQKVVGNNTTFLDVAHWRAELTRMEWRVCRIDHRDIGLGTGFLVGPDVVLTNHHVVERFIQQTSDPKELTCRFDYKVATAGDVIDAGETIELAGDWLIDAAPYSPVDLQTDPKSGDPTESELDFALLRLSVDVGRRAPGGGESEPRGWIELSPEPVDFANTRVIAILQHPLRLPLKLALGMEQELQVNAAGNRVRHTVPTEPGSSGSPLFDADWRLVALHHSGDPATVQPQFNEAIPISEIAKRPKIKEWLEELADDE